MLLQLPMKMFLNGWSGYLWCKLRSRMSAEEVRNQKLLLEYYKQQQENRQRRKMERTKKKGKARKK